MNRTISNPVVKDQVTFIQTAASTNGRITTLRVCLMPGGGTPLHYHRNFSETFVVIEGELTIVVEKRKMKLTTGQKFVVAANQSHQFLNDTVAPVHFMTTIIPGSEGFENALRILYGLAADKKTDESGKPKSILALASISAMSDMWPSGVPAFVRPLIKTLNIVAKIFGVRDALIEEYCENKD